MIDLFEPGDPRYSESTEIFNALQYRRPRYVTWPRSHTDLQAGFDLAAKRGLSVSVRGGGHGIAGRAIRGDLVLDLREFRAIETTESVVRVGAGCSWAQVDGALSAAGLVVPGGTVSSTGVAGLTLGGGVGWLLPKLGLTSDHLIGVTGVTTDGEVVRIDDRCGDAWIMPWLRGLGHGLLAVTEFEFDRVELPERIVGGSVRFSLDVAERVLARLLETSDECPADMNWSPALLFEDGELVLSVDGASFGEVRLDDWVGHVSSAAPRSSDVRVRSYPGIQAMLDKPTRWGQRSVWRSVYAYRLTESAVPLILALAQSAPSEGCLVFIERFTGAAKTPIRCSKFPLREADCNVLFAASWSDAADDHPHKAWADQACGLLRDALGDAAIETTYINYASDSERVGNLDLAQGLTDVCRVMDPQGLLSVSRRSG